MQAQQNDPRLEQIPTLAEVDNADGEASVRQRAKNRIAVGKTNLTTVARRISGLRFKQSTGDYVLARGGSEKGEQAKGGGIGRFLFGSFLLFVAFPPVVAFFYYFFIASDVYVAETKLTIRTASESAAKSSTLSSGASSIIGKLGLGQGNSSAQDSRIILDYLRSRAAIEDVGGRATLAALYDKPDIDRFSRLNSDESAEKLTAYWQEKVTASVDTVSNILTVRVRAYTADDAQSLAQKLVSSSEALVNRISRRSREDALLRAQEEVSRSMAELADARLQVLNLQQTTGSIDPTQNAKQIAALISTLTLKKVELESRLAVSDSAGVRGRPGERYLQSSLDVLNAKIRDMEAMLTGDKDSSVSMQLKDFELLKLRQEFAEQIYTLSRASYEEARRNVEKQQVYLVVIVPPFKPEYALFPRVFLDTLFVLLGCLVLWSIGALLIASVRDSTEL